MSAKKFQVLISTFLLNCLLIASGHADDSAASDKAKTVGQKAGEAVREVGEAGKEVGHKVAETAREVGHATRDGAKEFHKAVTGKSKKKKTHAASSASSK